MPRAGTGRDASGLELHLRRGLSQSPGQPRDGLTPAQRFFVGNAQWACSNIRPETVRLYTRTDPHAPARYRVNGLLVNTPEFQSAFQCKTGQPMVKPAEQICKVW